ncbi:LOW QUALITY PROTEIN: hypothetical protein V2J09_002322 [Rumex salicifolius]
METQTATPFPEEALQHILSFISSHADRNSVSLVCKSWYDIERWCRRHVFIGNCYSVSPPILIRRFTDVRSISIKGKHFLADYDFVPEGWGGHALPWIASLAAAYPAMEEIRLRRMVVTDEGLELIGKKLKNLRELVLCEGFSTHGLASIAANCWNLRTLDLSQSEVDDTGGNWISHFPASCTSLEFLNIDCLKSELHLSTLERLVGRCHDLKTLQLNRSFPLEKLAKLVLQAPQLIDLKMGLSTMDPDPYTTLAVAFAGLKGLKRLSGLWGVSPYYLPLIYPLCSGLTSLSLNTNLCSPGFVQVLRRCTNLQSLQVLDYIEDEGLEAVAQWCKELEELRVLPSDPYGADPSISLTERGLVSVAKGCPKLHSVLYCCSQMTNDALLNIAKHSPNLTCMRICILEPQLSDHLTHEPLDYGYGAIVKNCKSLKRLMVTGLVTDRLLEHIGTHGKKLEMLCLAFSGNTDAGLHHVLLGCDNLKKLIVRDCPFGGEVLLANSGRLERMQSLWMSSCPVSYGECKQLGEKQPKLNVEVINEKWALHSVPDECPVENLYVYRTIAGPRLDMPAFVWTTNPISLN